MLQLLGFLPEIFLSIVIFLQLIVNLWDLTKNNQRYKAIIDSEVPIQVLLIIILSLVLLSSLRISYVEASSIYGISFGRISLKIFVCMAYFLVIFPIYRAFITEKINFYEFFIITNLYILATFFLFSSYDLLLVFIAFELQSFCLYTLSGISRTSAFSAEAALKYFLIGAAGTLFFLIGCCCILISIGSLNFFVIDSFNIVTHVSDQFSSDLKLLKIGIWLIYFSLLVKLACFPFQAWAADVYDGVPLCSTIFFSIIPKVSLFSFFFLWFKITSVWIYDLQPFFLLLGFLTTFVGTFSALKQKRIKRMLVFSSIAQSGFLIATLGTSNGELDACLLTFLFIYILTSLIIWGSFALLYLSKNKIAIYFNKIEQQPYYITDSEHLFKSSKNFGFNLGLAFFSLAGIPPLVGFFAKAFILFNLLSLNYFFIPILFLTVAIFSTYYYIRMIKIFLFNSVDSKLFFGPLFSQNSIFFDVFILGIYSFILVASFFSPTTLFVIIYYISTFSVW
jgi:NADH-quinone oxidoreductase subunit N